MGEADTIPQYGRQSIAYWKTRHRLALARAEKAEAERDEWRDILQSLTPRGSEYTTPQECRDFVQAEREARHEIRKEKVRAERQRDAARAEILRKDRVLVKLAVICRNRQPDEVADGERIAREALKGTEQ